MLGVEKSIDIFSAKKYNMNQKIGQNGENKLKNQPKLQKNVKNPLLVNHKKTVKPLEMYLVGKGQLFGELGSIPELGITQHL
jgi:hypothetical protein